MSNVTQVIKSVRVAEDNSKKSVRALESALESIGQSMQNFYNEDRQISQCCTGAAHGPCLRPDEGGRADVDGAGPNSCVVDSFSPNLFYCVLDLPVRDLISRLSALACCAPRAWTSSWTTFRRSSATFC